MQTCKNRKYLNTKQLVLLNYLHVRETDRCIEDKKCGYLAVVGARVGDWVGDRVGVGDGANGALDGA